MRENKRSKAYLPFVISSVRLFNLTHFNISVILDYCVLDRLPSDFKWILSGLFNLQYQMHTVFFWYIYLSKLLHENSLYMEQPIFSCLCKSLTWYMQMKVLELPCDGYVFTMGLKKLSILTSVAICWPYLSRYKTRN